MSMSTTPHRADATAYEQGLPAVAGFGAILACAGLPIYIHAPKFYADEFGIGLGALGAVLLALRAFDFIQDPALGWLVGRFSQFKYLFSLAGGGLLATGMLLLFSIAPMGPAILWFGASLALVFTGYSLLTILFYAQGVGMAKDLGRGGHVRLAGWRETGTLIGVCFAAIAPGLLSMVFGHPLGAFAIGFVILLGFGLAAMAPHWRADGHVIADSAGFGAVLSDPVLRRLLIIAVFNAAPVAVTSTLFLFFVEDGLGAAAQAGLLLLLFFLAAGLSVRVWAKLANRFGPKQVLMAGMGLSIAAFLGVLMLSEGAVVAFGIICVASGIALGADMTLLPALFAGRVARSGASGAQAFGLWAFATKFTLALAAATVLPALAFFGYGPGGQNDPNALLALYILYAGLPCALKAVALWLLMRTKLEEG